MRQIEIPHGRAYLNLALALTLAGCSGVSGEAPPGSGGQGEGAGAKGAGGGATACIIYSTASTYCDTVGAATSSSSGCFDGYTPAECSAQSADNVSYSVDCMFIEQKTGVTFDGTCAEYDAEQDGGKKPGTTDPRVPVDAGGMDGAPLPIDAPVDVPLDQDAQGEKVGVDHEVPSDAGVDAENEKADVGVDSDAP